MLLFFDVETTGLPKNYKAHYSEVNNWPRVVQLSWLVSDDMGNIINESDNIIKPEGFSIPLEASKIHHITDDIANEKGKDLADVLDDFLLNIEKSKLIVCHNIDYDMPIFQCELYRKNMNAKIIKSKFCTMKNSTDFCQLPGNYGYKWPKLEELYYECFNKEMLDVHNAMADVMATYECYFYLKKEEVF